MRRPLIVCLLALVAAGSGLTAGDSRWQRNDDDRRHERRPALLFADWFGRDPLDRRDLVVAGAGLERVEYEASAPAWPGDRPGSLRARYDSSAPAGLLGFELARDLDASAPFTAAAVIVIRPDGFAADPNGFFQISWGLWNRHTTGLNRTGDLTGFATDTFDLLEFDYFPNVSPFFGGPFVSPSILGAANPDSPNFFSQGAFANAGFALGLELALPLGEPLLIVMEHKPGIDSVVVGVHRIVRPRRTIPVPGAVTVIPLDGLSLRDYEFDSVGLTLWTDGFGGSEPAVLADVDLHGLIVKRGFFSSVDSILRVPAPRN